MADLIEKLWKKGGPLVSLNEAERSAVFILSTKDLDRDGETVDPAGIDLAEFRKNPVIALNHDTSSLPIAASWRQPGAPVEVWLDEVEIDGQHKQALLGRAYFSQANPQGKLAFEMVKEGTLNGASVSFLPDGRPEKNSQGGNHWAKSRLLEWSICPLGSNPHALALAYGRLKALNGETPMAKKQADDDKDDEKEDDKEDDKEDEKEEEPVEKGELDQENPPMEEPVIVEPGEKSVAKQQPSEDIDPEKACQILRDGEVNGQALTEEQRGMFGAACARANGSKGFTVCPSCAGTNGAAAKALCPSCVSHLRKSLGPPVKPSAPAPEPPAPRVADGIADVVEILADQQGRLSKSEQAVSKHCQAVLKALLVEPVEAPLTVDEIGLVQQAVEQLKRDGARLGESWFRATGQRV